MVVKVSGEIIMAFSRKIERKIIVIMKSKCTILWVLMMPSMALEIIKHLRMCYKISDKVMTELSKFEDISLVSAVAICQNKEGHIAK